MVLGCLERGVMSHVTAYPHPDDGTRQIGHRKKITGGGEPTAVCLTLETDLLIVTVDALICDIGHGSRQSHAPCNLLRYA